MSSNSGILWIVATPIGNPGDLSPRARQVLTCVDGILCEDTRRTGLLFVHAGLQAGAPLTSFHEHNEEERLGEILDWLGAGKSLALVSDAGTPLVSDPGYRLVRACRQQGIRVSPIPGPSAPAAALSAAGIAPIPYAFLGFLPRRSTDRKKLFQDFERAACTLIFFERKDRIAASLADALAVLGNREVCIARELTKTHEEFLRLQLSEAAALPDALPGEITVILGPPLEEARDRAEEILERILEERLAGGKPRDIATRVKDRSRGWTGKEIYRLIRKEEDE